MCFHCMPCQHASHTYLITVQLVRSHGSYRCIDPTIHEPPQDFRFEVEDIASEQPVHWLAFPVSAELVVNAIYKAANDIPDTY